MFSYQTAYMTSKAITSRVVLDKPYSTSAFEDDALLSLCK